MIGFLVFYIIGFCLGYYFGFYSGQSEGQFEKILKEKKEHSLRVQEHYDQLRKEEELEKQNKLVKLRLTK